MWRQRIAVSMKTESLQTSQYLFLLVVKEKLPRPSGFSNSITTRLGVESIIVVNGLHFGLNGSVRTKLPGTVRMESKRSALHNTLQSIHGRQHTQSS